MNDRTVLPGTHVNAPMPPVKPVKKLIPEKLDAEVRAVEYATTEGRGMSDYGIPHINRLEGVPGVFRIWTDDGDQKTSRLVTVCDLIAFRAKIDEMLTADQVEFAKWLSA